MTHHLFAFDIDGTLFNDKKEILPSTKEALSSLQKNGHFVMIATGRSLKQARPIIDELKLTSYLLCNGAAGFIDNVMIYKNMLSKHKIQAMIEVAKQHQLDIAMITLHGEYRQELRLNKITEEAMQSFGPWIPEYRPLSEIDEDVCQAVLFCNEEQEKYFEAFKDDFRFVRWHPYGVDILPKENSKAHALKEIARIKGLSNDQLYAFGDGNNDYEMLLEVGHGIAMGNAVERTKEVAEFVTDDCNHDGIYKALKHYDFI